MPESEYKGSYGKKPLWFWILLYVVIGLLVYGAVYYFFLSKNGGYNYKGVNYQNSTSSNNFKY